MKQVQDDVFLHRKQRDTEQSQNHQLDRADFPEEGAVGDQRAGDTEVCIDEAEGGQEENKNRSLAKRWIKIRTLRCRLFTLQKMR